MTDIKSARLLWIKGGLFLLLGCLASGILLLSVGNLAVAVLLAIAVWAFCRAYYFAFNVFEKYADPNFRYSGLKSLARYCVAGPERFRQSQDNLAGSSSPAELSQNHLEAVEWLAVKWFAFAMMANLLAPSVYRLTMLSRPSVVKDLQEVMWTGWCAVIACVCVLVGALLTAPLKYRVPVSFGAPFCLSPICTLFFLTALSSD